MAAQLHAVVAAKAAAAATCDNDKDNLTVATMAIPAAGDEPLDYLDADARVTAQVTQVLKRRHVPLGPCVEAGCNCKGIFYKVR